MVKLKNIVNYKISLDKIDQSWRHHTILLQNIPQSFITVGHHSSLQKAIGGELQSIGLYSYESCVSQYYCPGTMFPFVCKSGKSLMEVANCLPVGFNMFSIGGNLYLIHKTRLKPVTEEIIESIRGVTVDSLPNGYDVLIKIHFN